ncbi:MAG: CDP-alcohol phosphatidyltransferase family protein [Micrococcales bacterium]|nr:CDP-alcohol phosphatidyltransferase family protein [Micrococcales bacterium]
MMIGVRHRANLVTYLGVAVAGLGLVVAARDLGWAVLCLVVAGVCDLLDGTYARRFPRDEATRAFGAQLDSLADMVSFVALPAALLVALGLDWRPAALVVVAYATAAVTRLADFTVTASPRPTGYRGLPVTYAALVLPLVWLVCTVVEADPVVPWSLAMVLLAAGFVVDVPWPKPRARGIVVFVVVAVLVGGGIVGVQTR